MPDTDDNNAKEPSSKAFARPRSPDSHNQGTSFGAVFLWNDLRFGALSEIAIAEALDKAGILFVPNCKVRISGLGGRENREPTFLISHESRLGILQIDDQRSDQSPQTDSERIREQLLFQLNGFSVKHFHWLDCLQKPDQIVAQFLRFLGGAS